MESQIEDTTRWQAIYEESHGNYVRYFSDFLESADKNSSDLRSHLDALEIEHISVIAALENTEQMTERLILRIMVVNLLSYFSERGHIEERNFWAEKALRSAKDDQNQLDIFFFTVMLARYYIENDSVRSRQLADEGLALSEKLGDQQWIAMAQETWGRAYLDSEYYKKAQDRLEHAGLLYAGLGDYTAVTGVAISLGDYWTEQGDFNKSRYYLESALKLARAYHQEGLEIKILSLMGILYLNQNIFLEAETCFQESLQKSFAVESRDDIAANINALGLINWKKGNFAEAEKLFAESLQRFDANKNKNSKRFVLNNLALLAFESGDPKKSRVYRERAIEISRKIEGGRIIFF